MMQRLFPENLTSSHVRNSYGHRKRYKTCLKERLLDHQCLSMQLLVSLSPKRTVTSVYARIIGISIKKQFWIPSLFQSSTISSAILVAVASSRNSILVKPSTRLVLQRKHDSTLLSSYH